MFQIQLKNKKTFDCKENQTIFDAARSNGVLLEHSCLAARCKSCKIKISSGSYKNVVPETVLSTEERSNGYALSCNTIPLSDLRLNNNEVDISELIEKQILPVKISSIEKIKSDILKLKLRFPPKTKFMFYPGQYIKLSRGNITRSYSISSISSEIELIIRRYENGKMSDYLFDHAEINDLLRIEGPFGTFFLRKNGTENLIFLATGTGIAPIKAMLEELDNSKEVPYSKIWLFYGTRNKNDLFWKPNFLNLEINYFPVLSRDFKDWNGENGYVQDVVIKKKIDLKKSHVYACGSSNMIRSAKKVLTENFLEEEHFFSDEFIQSN